MQQSETNIKEIGEAKYAQFVSSVISQYDASLIFYQIKPVQTSKGNIQNFKGETEEVARVTLSHRALVELGNLLSKQIKEMEGKKGEDKTIEKLKKERGK
ncbi:hypothetical protein COY07_00560 [Candidatus Peregrinibacteria bacterium CG_4_10_14_0_2_um_filter_43_11]|nr:MAG: hypothetical protein COY07_00560 [Candidatus Peregrinibacteria bacterium CG_4_10_14_0_2_um_filter_43_11]